MKTENRLFTTSELEIISAANAEIEKAKMELFTLRRVIYQVFFAQDALVEDELTTDDLCQRIRDVGIYLDW